MLHQPSETPVKLNEILNSSMFYDLHLGQFNISLIHYMVLARFNEHQTDIDSSSQVQLSLLYHWAVTATGTKQRCAQLQILREYRVLDCGKDETNKTKHWHSLIHLLMFSLFFSYRYIQQAMPLKGDEGGCYPLCQQNDLIASPLLTCHPPLHPLVAERVQGQRDCLVEYVCLTH